MSSCEQIFALLNTPDQDPIVEALKQNPKLAACQNDLGQTVLWLASANGFKSVVELLLSPAFKGLSNPYCCDVSGRTAYDIAKFYELQNIVDVLDAELGVTALSKKVTNHQALSIEYQPSFIAEIKNFFDKEYAVKPSFVITATALASVLVILVTVAINTLNEIRHDEGNFNPDELIANGDQLDLSQDVKDALNMPETKVDFEDLELFASHGGYRVQAKKSSVSDGISCEINLSKEDGWIKTYLIRADNISFKSPEVTTNVTELNMPATPEGIEIIRKSIIYCFG